MKLPIKLLGGLLLTVLIVLPSQAQAPELLPPNNFALVEGNTMQAIGQISPNFRVLGVFLPEMDIIYNYDWDASKMIDILLCESSGNPNAYNPEWHTGCRGSYGYFQVACVHKQYVDSLEDLYDPVKNIEVAYQVWRDQGMSAWQNCDRLLDN